MRSPWRSCRRRSVRRRHRGRRRWIGSQIGLAERDHLDRQNWCELRGASFICCDLPRAGLKRCKHPSGKLLSEMSRLTHYPPKRCIAERGLRPCRWTTGRILEGAAAIPALVISKSAPSPALVGNNSTTSTHVLTVANIGSAAKGLVQRCAVAKVGNSEPTRSNDTVDRVTIE